MYHFTVEAYISGYEMGPAYGPPLSELTHSCRGFLPCDDKQEIQQSTHARGVRGKLLLYKTLLTSISLLDSVVSEVDKFKYFCCHHGWCALPAVIMEAIERWGK